MNNSPLRIIQLSDTHLYANPHRSLLGVKTKESFQAVLELLRNQKEKIDLIVHSGDISQDFSHESYQQLADMLSELNVPVHCVPGNHDDPKIMAQVFPRGMVSMQKNVLLRNWQFILLNSNKPGSVEGYLDASELKFMQDCLAAYPDHKSIVIFHHHPMPVGVKWLDNLGLSNAKEFWDTIGKFKNAHTVLFGHVHQEHEEVINGIPCYALPSTCIQFKCKQENFGLDHAPPGYRLLNLYDDGKVETEIVRAKKYIGTYEPGAKGY